MLGRLVILGIGAAGALAVLAAQTARLTVGRGEALRQDAEKRLIVEKWLPTVRGPILDRKGRTLAADRPSFDVAVDYDVITGDWAFDQAGEQAHREHAQDWDTYSSAQRDELILNLVPAYQAQLDYMWFQLSALTGVEREVIEARRDEIKKDVQALAAHIWERQRLARERLLLKDKGERIAVSTADVARDIREQRSAHTVLRAVDDQTAFSLMRLAERGESTTGDAPSFPGLRVVNSTKRARDLGIPATMVIDRASFPSPLAGDPMTVSTKGAIDTLVGTLRERPFKEDMDRRPKWRASDPLNADSPRILDRGFYAPDDAVGAAGLERSAEDELRGLRGLESRHLDTGEVERIAAELGQAVTTTIDSALQARIAALFDPALGLAVVQPWHRNAAMPLGTKLGGAVVVLDVDSGDVLAMVNAAPQARTLADGTPDPSAAPELNRCISVPYPPGSIVKPLILCAATAEAKFSLSEHIECTGHLLPNDTQKFRCWIYKQFGTTHSVRFGHDLSGADAIMGSCNIFFYELGRRLGPDALRTWYGRFGINGTGEPGVWGFGIADEFPGQIKGGGPAGSPTAGECILMGIGQGPVAWTPMHAAAAYATIARAGVSLSPRLRADAPSRRIDLHLPPAAVDEALNGLRLAAAEHDGTANHITIDLGDSSVQEPIFNTPGIAIWAKTGTATASIIPGRSREPSPSDPDGDETQSRYLDHSWCVCLAGEEGAGGIGGRPRFAVAVLIELGGSGGRVAGPVANQVVRALAAEGYLTAKEEPKQSAVP